MLRKFVIALFFSFSIFYLFSLSFVNFVFAEETRANGMVTFCLHPIKYYRDCPSGVGDACEREADPPGGFPDEDKPNHTLLLEGSSPDTKLDDVFSNSDIYIVGCISKDDDYHCTTGNPQGDNVLYSKTGFVTSDRFYIDGSGKIEYEFVPNNNPVQDGSPADVDGSVNHKIRVVVRSYTPELLNHIFVGVFPINLDPDGNIIDNQGNTIELSSFDFITAENLGNHNCTTVTWDPEGYVFDAQSLQPLSGVKIALLDKTGVRLPNAPGFKNPIETDRFGSYFFFVKPGFYKFQIDTPDYEIVSRKEDINPDYNNLTKGHNYRCEGIVSEAYLSDQTAQEKEGIYLSGKTVQEEAGKVLRCDIPVKRLSNTSQKLDYIIYDKSILADKTNHIITAKVWPHYGTFRVTQNGKELYSDTAKDGLWKAVIPNEKIDPTAQLTLEFVPNRVVSSIDISYQDNTQAVLGAESGFSPIFPYIEGYAYLNDKTIAKNAIVYVVHKATNKPIIAVKTDENGYFKILPEFLLPFQYQLKIIDNATQKEVIIPTEKFALQNYAYLKAEKIDLLTMKRENKQIQTNSNEKKDFVKNIVVPPERVLAIENQSKNTLENNQSFNSENNNKTDKSKKNNLTTITEVSQTKQTNSLLALFITFSLTLIVFFIFLILYIRKRKESFS